MNIAFETYILLDISTAHISREDDIFLKLEARTPGSFPGSVHEVDHGFFIWLCGQEISTEGFVWEAAISEAFKKLIELAIELNIGYIRLDSDGKVYDDLETFDW